MVWEAEVSQMVWSNRQLPRFRPLVPKELENLHSPQLKECRMKQHFTCFTKVWKKARTFPDIEMLVLPRKGIIQTT